MGWDLGTVVRSLVGYHSEETSPGLRVHNRICQQHPLQEQMLEAKQCMGSNCPWHVVRRHLEEPQKEF